MATDLGRHNAPASAIPFRPNIGGAWRCRSPPAQMAGRTGDCWARATCPTLRLSAVSHTMISAWRAPVWASIGACGPCRFPHSRNVLRHPRCCRPTITWFSARRIGDFAEWLSPNWRVEGGARDCQPPRASCARISSKSTPASFAQAHRAQGLARCWRLSPSISLGRWASPGLCKV
jgi:hypothetical protein